MRRRTHHPIRQLRDALSEVRGQRITQAMFARMVGVSAALINALESRASRVLSADLQERIAMRFGVHLEAGRNARVICVMFPNLPLVEALRRYQDEQPLVEAGALRAFDEHGIRFLRSALLAAHKKKKAAIFWDLLQARTRQLLKDLQVSGSFAEAKKEIAAHRGQFPSELFPAAPAPNAPPAADPEFLACGKALLAKGHTRLRRIVAQAGGESATRAKTRGNR